MIKENRLVFAITDVMVWDMKSPRPEGFDAYTGVNHDSITCPYIPEVIGARAEGLDVNKGIGGHDVAIYVRYELIDPTDANIMVATDIAVTHWPNWGPAVTPDGHKCPYDGWDSANGRIANIKGALTPGTKGACWRNGLVVQYKRITETETFLTNLYMSITNNKAPVYPKYAEANQGFWPMQASPLDIHCKCGDSKAYHLCFAKGKVAPPFPNPAPSVTNEKKLELIRKYAPYIYMHTQEAYFPSTVEFSFKYLERYKNSDGQYWLRTKDKLSSPSSVLPYFGGDLNNAKVYAFWVKKKPFNINEITYFFYYPYNRGKEVFNTIWGNHVGDWEHVTVRLAWEFNDGKWDLTPIEVYLSAHGSGNLRNWSQVAKNGNSPIAYSAKGSHAMYFDEGGHVYEDKVIFKLTDYCDKGAVFNTALANRIAAFDKETQQGLDGSVWPSWMSSDFTTAGPNPNDPSSGGIYRWGNTKQGCDFGFGQCRLENGPTGPISKDDVWNPDILEGQ